MKKIILFIILSILFGCTNEPTNTDLCSPNPCTLPNKTKCMVIKDEATCQCNTGYIPSGAVCIKAQTCADNPCKSDEICSDSNGEIVCNCKENFTKINEICIFDCSDILNSEVNSTNDGCDCVTGYFKNQEGICEILETNPCEPNPCTERNKTICTALNENDFTCSCEDGYHLNGNNCVETVNPCDFNPCTQQNKEVCTATGNEIDDYTCSCNEGYHLDGNNCVQTVNPCEPNNCTETNKNICTATGNEIGNYTCSCNDGYHLNGTTCVQTVNPCEPNLCTQANKNICTATGNEVGQYTCSCNDGYHLNGTTCVQTVNPCEPNLCTQTNKNVCTATGNEAGQYTCSCNDGFHLNGTTCVQTVNPCEPNLCTQSNKNVCTATGNEAGQYTCSCNDGYQPSENGTCVVMTTYKLRFIAGNISSGNYQDYPVDLGKTTGPGMRIFQALKGDIIMIQEFNYKNNTASDLREFTTVTFGSEFSYIRGSGDIPNGVISRYPITQSGFWDDPYIANRDLDWAIIDIPGTVDLMAISVHLHTSPSSDQVGAAQVIARKVSEHRATNPGKYYYVVGGDFNGTASVSSNGFGKYNGEDIFYVLSPHPVDELGDTATNATGSSQYDFVLLDHNLKAFQIPVVYVNPNNTSETKTYINGLVFDTRVYSEADLLKFFVPALRSDSGASNMQHMAIVKDVLIGQ